MFKALIEHPKVFKIGAKVKVKEGVSQHPDKPGYGPCKYIGLTGTIVDFKNNKYYPSWDCSVTFPSKSNKAIFFRFDELELI